MQPRFRLWIFKLQARTDADGSPKRSGMLDPLAYLSTGTPQRSGCIFLVVVLIIRRGAETEQIGRKGEIPVVARLNEETAVSTIFPHAERRLKENIPPGNG